MNLYFRLFLTFLRSWIYPKATLFSEVISSFRVWFMDMDINIHLTNSRYLSFMDLGRTQLLVQGGLLGYVLKNKMQLVVFETRMRYYKGIGPFQKVDLKTRLESWDEKYFHLTQQFFVKGTLMAEGKVKAVILDPKGKVKPVDFIQNAGIDMENNTLVSPAS